MREYPSIYRGIVESNEDPKNLGRCKIRVPSVHGELTYPVDILPWARPIVLSPINGNRGSVNIPDKGDIVWVFFEGALKDYPVYLGGTYSTKDIQIDRNKVILYEESNNQLGYDRISDSFFVKIGDSIIVLNSQGVSIQGNAHIEGDVSINGNLLVNGNLEVAGSETIVGDLLVGGSVDTKRNVQIQGSIAVTESMVVGGSATVGGATVKVDGLSNSDLDDMLSELEIERGDYTDTELKFIAIAKDISTSGNPVATASSYSIRVQDYYCQRFVADFYKAAIGSRPSYASAKAAYTSTTTYQDISTIKIGAAVFGESTAAPQYGHVAIYVGNGTVMHVKSGDYITIESIDDLINSSWFTYTGWGTYNLM